MAEPVPKFRGRITNGLFLPEEGLRRKQYLSYLISKEGQEVDCIIKPPTENKSQSQLGYYFGVICKIGGEELGYTIEEMKEVLKAELLVPEIIQTHSGKEVKIYPSIARMTKMDLSRHIEDSIILLAKLGIVIRDPNSYFIEKMFDFER